MSTGHVERAIRVPNMSPMRCVHRSGFSFLSEVANSVPTSDHGCTPGVPPPKWCRAFASGLTMLTGQSSDPVAITL